VREGACRSRIVIRSSRVAGSDALIELTAALQAAHDVAGRLDVVVATLGGAFQPLLMLDTPTLRAELELNLVSAFLAIRHGAPLMRSGASIVCISRDAGRLRSAHRHAAMAAQPVHPVKESSMKQRFPALATALCGLALAAAAAMIPA